MVGVNYQELYIITQISMKLLKIGYLLILEKGIKPLIQTAVVWAVSDSSLILSSVFLPNAVKQCFLGIR